MKKILVMAVLSVFAFQMCSCGMAGGSTEEQTGEYMGENDLYGILKSNDYKMSKYSGEYPGRFYDAITEDFPVDDFEKYKQITIEQTPLKIGMSYKEAAEAGVNFGKLSFSSRKNSEDTFVSTHAYISDSNHWFGTKFIVFEKFEGGTETDEMLMNKSSFLFELFFSTGYISSFDYYGITENSSMGDVVSIFGNPVRIEQTAGRITFIYKDKNQNSLRVSFDEESKKLDDLTIGFVDNKLGDE